LVLARHPQLAASEQAMKFDAFIDAVDNLVREWSTEPNEIGELLPRDQLQAIYDDVREQAVHDLAEAVRARDAATRTHGMLITIDRKHKHETATRPDRPSRPRETA